jgi:hypothetical protein
VTVLPSGAYNDRMSFLARKPRTASVGIILSLALLAVGCGGSGVKLIASVRPLPTLSPARCISFIARHNARGKPRVLRAYARSVCRQEPRNSHWYDWRIKNASSRSTFAYCSAIAYNAHGRKLWMRPLGPQPLPWSVPLKPGASFRLRSFFPVFRGTSLPGRVARYKPICRTTKVPLS